MVTTGALAASATFTWHAEGTKDDVTIVDKKGVPLPPFKLSPKVTADVSYTADLKLTVTANGTLDRSKSSIDFDVTATPAGTVSIPGFTSGLEYIDGGIGVIKDGLDALNVPGLIVGEVVDFLQSVGIIPSASLEADVPFLGEPQEQVGNIGGAAHEEAPGRILEHVETGAALKDEESQKVESGRDRKLGLDYALLLRAREDPEVSERGEDCTSQVPA